VVRPEVELPEPPAPGAFPHEIFDAVLRERVNAEGKVDYQGLQSDRGELDRYVAYLAVASPERDPELFPTRDDQLAYWLNAYNALAMTAVIDRPGLKSVVDNKVDFFYATRYVVGGRNLDLYRMENGVVRPTFQDPRVHFALNCQSEGCPVLPNSAFPAQGLDARLEEVTRAFVTDPRKVQVDGNTLRVSQIFEWYAEDFEAAGGAAGFVRKYRDDVPESPTLEYIPYDWALIAQEGRGP
jgi:hypothetical protein